jgi:hypothetical protein
LNEHDGGESRGDESPSEQGSEQATSRLVRSEVWAMRRHV